MELRLPDFIRIYGEDKAKVFECKCDEKNLFKADFEDISIKLEKKETLEVRVKAETTPLTFIRLRYNFTEAEKRKDKIKILGNTFAFGNGQLEWGGIKPERTYPWYMLVSNGSDSEPELCGRYTEGFGVKTMTNSFVIWQYDSAGMLVWIDVRNGGKGVHLNCRELLACEILFGEFRDISAFHAGKEFCRMMCPTPVLPKNTVYGSNNWYYAYGKSSHEDILKDSRLVSESCKGLDSVPYMVIDAGWQKDRIWKEGVTASPWNELNENFRDMKALASEMSELGVIPGIWIRFLFDRLDENNKERPDLRFKHSPQSFDPSHPEVIDYVKRIIKTIVGWGYKLIKHDFSTYDIFGDPCGTERITPNGWSFYDKTRTSAEIVVDFYKAIRDAAGDDCIILGCDSIGHLCAGIFEVCRTGCDTSGRNFEDTRKMGVNTLAFKLMQNKTFYVADADCVGIMGPIPWALNREWLNVLANSGSPLFVSRKPGVLNESEIEELREAYKINSIQTNELRPLDWMENTCPNRWLLDGKEIVFNWYDSVGPEYYNPYWD